MPLIIVVQRSTDGAGSCRMTGSEARLKLPERRLPSKRFGIPVSRHSWVRLAPRSAAWRRVFAPAKGSKIDLVFQADRRQPTSRSITDSSTSFSPTNRPASISQHQRQTRSLQARMRHRHQRLAAGRAARSESRSISGQSKRPQSRLPRKARGLSRLEVRLERSSQATSWPRTEQDAPPYTGRSCCSD